jgi:hypothetical protein
MDRRNWLTRLGGLLTTGGIISAAACGKTGQNDLAPAATPRAEGLPEGLNHYFGDLHNHCEVGYARGSLTRAFEIAGSQLDFYSCTPHSWWPDVPKMTQSKEQKWLDGFEVTKRRWPEVQKLNSDYHRPGEFVTFPGYEWHSSRQ